MVTDTHTTQTDTDTDTDTPMHTHARTHTHTHTHAHTHGHTHTYTWTHTCQSPVSQSLLHAMTVHPTTALRRGWTLVGETHTCLVCHSNIEFPGEHQ